MGLSRIITSIQGHPSLPLSLQSQKAAAEENAESETSTFRMNNAAMNETAALCHENWYENYRRTNATLIHDVRPTDSNSTRENVT